MVNSLDVGENNPGFAIQWSSDAQLHQCLAPAMAPPVTRGANAVASRIAIQTWFVGLMTAAAPGCQAIVNGVPSSSFFHHITATQAVAIRNALTAIPLFNWANNLSGAGRTAGTMMEVYPLGVGSNTMLQSTLGPFQ